MADGTRDRRPTHDRRGPGGISGVRREAPARLGAGDRALTPIRRLFVANRGEIAGRIAASADRLGIEAFVPGIEPTPVVDLLDATAVVEAARAVHADALHPGYGFLSESAAFATAVEAAGIRWVGPPAAAISAMGDKGAARRLAMSLGVPVVPGYDGEDGSPATLAREADRIGYPILIKPAGGGGGKGMRTVRTPDRLPESIAAARREAKAAFGDERLILERLVEGVRHVEVQLLFDAAGNGVHLGERDCSLQRRHQKVLEESPSPGIHDALRDGLGSAALRLAGAVGYVGAGTCEFLVGDRGDFWFLEMNTRLQVEHPVTEGLTRRDLVADQLAISAGATLESLGLDQAAADATRTEGGHAIEVRLYAEDAEAGFLPSTGRVVALGWPAAASRFEWTSDVRVDAGIEPGMEVGDRFDPMLAKVIARGRTRGEAIDRLASALDEVVVLGLVTNLRFLRWLVRAPAVADGEVRIDTLERIWPPDDWAARTRIPDAAWAEAAAGLAAAHAAELWSGGWRLNAAPRLSLEAEGESRTVSLEPARSEVVRSVVDGTEIHLDLAGRSVGFRLSPAPDVDAAAAAGGRAAAAVGEAPLVAPMPGAVIAVHAQAAALVEAGSSIVTLEAMKMEHVIVAPFAGRLDEILVRPGDQVARGQLLGRIVPPEAAPR
ncbi:MAG TPA: biotin carboxylase N-terminal domain-containing protein [Candidatus Limnocylindrales bacterium]|nr:biotin carboxylase N-terminal domain-containing protein [Candidatus Limnocylindrales bacterium]